MGPLAYVLIAAILVVKTDAGRSLLKSAMKAGIKLGTEAKEQFDELAEKAKELKHEVMEEAKLDGKASERKQPEEAL